MIDMDMPALGLSVLPRATCRPQWQRQDLTANESVVLPIFTSNIQAFRSGRWPFTHLLQTSAIDRTRHSQSSPTAPGGSGRRPAKATAFTACCLTCSMSRHRPVRSLTESPTRPCASRPKGWHCPPASLFPTSATGSPTSLGFTTSARRRPGFQAKSDAGAERNKAHGLQIEGVATTWHPPTSCAAAGRTWVTPGLGPMPLPARLPATTARSRPHVTSTTALQRVSIKAGAMPGPNSWVPTRGRSSPSASRPRGCPQCRRCRGWQA